jgi:uncharacterized glyoxalase superfamily protein PhnB
MFYEAAQLPANASVPPSVVTPILAYPDVRKAVDWLCETFGFVERLQIAEHRAQLVFGGGAMIVAEYIDRDRPPAEGADHVSHQIMVRVEDVQRHFDHSVSCGAEILEPITEHFFGERQYVVRDIGGHRWTFSQTLRDVHPSEWGDENVILKHR